MTAQGRIPTRSAEASRNEANKEQASSSDSCSTTQASFTKLNTLRTPSTRCNEHQRLSDHQLGAVHLASLRSYYSSPHNAPPLLADGGHSKEIAPKVNNKRTLPFDQGTEAPSQRRRILHASNHDERAPGREGWVQCRAQAADSPNLTLPSLQIGPIPARVPANDGTESHSDLHGNTQAPTAHRASPSSVSSHNGHNYGPNLVSGPGGSHSSFESFPLEGLHSAQHAIPVKVHTLPRFEAGFARIPQSCATTPKMHLTTKMDAIPVIMSTSIDGSRKHTAVDGGHGTEATHPLKVERRSEVSNVKETPHDIEGASSGAGLDRLIMEGATAMASYFVSSGKGFKKRKPLAFLANSTSAFSVRYGALETFKPREQRPSQLAEEGEWREDLNTVTKEIHAREAAASVREVKDVETFREALLAPRAQAQAELMDLKRFKQRCITTIGDIEQEKFVQKHMRLLLKDADAGDATAMAPYFVSFGKGFKKRKPLAFLVDSKSAFSVRYGALETFKPREQRPSQLAEEGEWREDLNTVTKEIHAREAAASVREVKDVETFREALLAPRAQAQAELMDLKRFKQRCITTIGDIEQEKFVQKHMHLLLKDADAGDVKPANYGT